MRKRAWLFEVGEQEQQAERTPNLDHILQLKLSELAGRNIALRIQSEILDYEIWLCGNAEMVSQIKRDDPEAIYYTADEVRKLYTLQPSPEELRAIHNTKTVFSGSRVIDSVLQENRNESK